jgi:uncharacterized membrane protein (UPF0136 family)
MSQQQQAVLHDLVASMGGMFAYMFDTSITHFILGTFTPPSLSMSSYVCVCK